MTIIEAKPNLGFEKLFDQVPGSILVLDLKSEEVLASSATFRHTFGYKHIQSGTDIGSLKVFRSDQSKRASFERLKQLYSKGVRRGADAHRRLYTVKDEAIDCRINWRIVEASDRIFCVLLLEDVTREYEAIKRLQHAEEHLGAAFTANPDAMAIISPVKATFVTCNDRFYEITGFDRNQITGKSATELQIWVCEEDRLAWLQACERSGYRLKDYFMEIRVKGANLPVILMVEPYGSEEQLAMVTVKVASDPARSDERSLREIVKQDDLTGLPNRSLIAEYLGVAATSWMEVPSKFTGVVSIGIDRFRAINDSMGHRAGDSLLIETAHRLRTFPLPIGSVIGRGRGAEFIAVINLKKTENIDEAEAYLLHLAEELRVALSSPVLVENTHILLKPTIGIAIAPYHGINPEALLQRSAMAMQNAKKEGRTAVALFDQWMQDRIKERQNLERELRIAAMNEEFSLNFQPQFDTDIERFTGVEVLLRWPDPNGGYKSSPDAFIPVLEETGLIVEVGNWVLHNALARIRTLLTTGLIKESFTLSVNVSPRQLASPDFVKQVETALWQSGVPADMLILEITESMLIDNVYEVLLKLAEIRKLGVHISMDDFGTGYSSLSAMKNLPIGCLKIDKSFIDNAITDMSDAAIVRTIIGMGMSLGLNIIAEGVETTEQVQYLKELGCSQFQGYYFSKPVAYESLCELLEGEKGGEGQQK